MSSNIGGKIGDTIKGVLDAGHGAGEVIRGNFNSSVDNAGEGLRNSGENNTADNNSVPGRSSDYDQAGNHNNVAQSGSDEMKDGLNRISNAFGSSNTNTTSTDKSTGL